MIGWLIPYGEALTPALSHRRGRKIKIGRHSELVSESPAKQVKNSNIKNKI